MARITPIRSLLASLADDGSVAWQTVIAGTSGVYVTDVVVEEAGDLIAVGVFLGTFEGHDAGAGVRTFIGRWRKDAATASEGEAVWVTTFPSASTATSLTRGVDGQLVFYSQSAGAELAVGTSTIPGDTPFIGALSTDGALLWASPSELQHQFFADLAVLPEGDGMAAMLYLVGQAELSAFELTSTGALPHTGRTDLGSYCGVAVDPIARRLYTCPSTSTPIDGIIPTRAVNAVVQLSN